MLSPILSYYDRINSVLAIPGVKANFQLYSVHYDALRAEYV